MAGTGSASGRPGIVTRGTEAIEAGVAAGVIGGVAMLSFLVIWAVATGRSVLMPSELFGALFYGAGTFEAGFRSALWGTALHLAVSGALGVAFTALIGRGTDPMVAASAGIFYALLAWVFLTFVVVPIVAPAMKRVLDDMAIAWFGAHVPFGAALSLGLQFRAALDDRERSVQEA